MIEAQIFCTLQELIDDLRLLGDEPGLYKHVQAASRLIQRRLGNFIPTTEARKFGVPDLGYDLRVDPLLAVTSITNNGTAVTDYTLYPINAHWLNGPYTRIAQDQAWGIEDENIVTGRWGKYEETELLTPTATQAATTTADLTLTDGSAISVGAVLLIGSEQELVTSFGASSDSTATLNGGHDDSTETIAVSDGTKVKKGEVMRIDTEDMYIRAIYTNDVIVTRGWNNTARAAHLTAAKIYVYRTFNTARGVNGTTAAIHTTAALSRYVVPADVNFLCREIAASMRMKALSSFSGKVGNDQGEMYYYTIFQKDIAEVAKHYRVNVL